MIKLLHIKGVSGHRNIDLIIEGAVNRSKANLVYYELLKYNFIIGFIRIVDKISHNGCRSKVKNTNLRKRRYLG